MEYRHSRRDLLQQAIFVGGGTLVLGACTSGSGKSNSTDSGGADLRLGSSLPPIEGGQVILDPTQFPTKFKESPDFAKMVSAGTLPPVEQRIGKDPLVIKPLHSIGKYGGEIRRGYISVGDYQNAIRFCAGPDSMLYFDYQGKTLVPNIAKGYEFNKDKTVLTLHLRRGMKWSDGHPFTADDIIFWYEDMALNKDVTDESETLLGLTIKKVDDYTLHYISTKPYPLLPKILAMTTDLGGMTVIGKTGQGGYAPKHYLSKFHPKYSSVKAANKQAQAAGFDNWPLYLLHQNDWTLNKDVPTVTPWVMTRPINNSPWTLEANPYSIWVDSAGNQLPYIPKITMRDAGNQEVLTLRAVSGEYDVQDRNLQLTSLPVLLKNQKRSSYTVHRAPVHVLDFQLQFNLSYVKDKVIGDLIRNVDFRRGLSLAIDRNQINQTFFLGTSVPTAMMAADDSPYFPGPEWRTKWATHDVTQANQLLDKVGLTKKDASGYRLRPDGKGPIRLGFLANKTLADYPAMGEMVRSQWKSIGIDVVIQSLQVNIAIQRTLSNDFHIRGIGSSCEDPFIKPNSLLPVTDLTGPMAIPYAKWYLSNGKDGIKPPSSMKLLVDAMNLYDAARPASDKERINAGKKIYMMHADQVWSIGVLGFGLTVYGIYMAKNNIANVPARFYNSELLRNPTMGLPMTYYYT